MLNEDPLAHLYAETGSGPVDDEGLGIERSTSLEELTAETGAEEEILSASDLEELYLLVVARLGSRSLTDEDAAELGLGDLVDGELVLNRTGRAIVSRLIDERFPEIRRST